MKTTTIPCTTDIYNTQYTIRDYGRHIVVTCPRIKWTDNTGCLDFFKARIEGSEDLEIMRAFVADQSMCVFIDNVLYRLSDFVN